jgi:hypothetical protein
MTPADAADILTIAAAFDRRKIGKADAIAWADALHDLDVRDCVDAVRAHFRESTDYLMPVHVRQGVKRIRADRVRSANAAILEPHDVDPRDVAAYTAEKRRRIAAIASGRAVSVEPVGAVTRSVAELMEDAVKSLPAMPPAFPVADIAKKRLPVPTPTPGEPR